MILDKNFSVEILKDFLKKNDEIFTHPLSETLLRQHTTIDNWTTKLCSKATFAFELDKSCVKGVVIGYTKNLPADGGGYITIVAVAPECRKQGIAGRLLQEYIAYSKNKTKYLWLTTDETNIPARRLYEKVGFVLQTIENNRCKYIYQF
jgi:ribosomal protein S18 acetylase RimI-like enzyme